MRPIQVSIALLLGTIFVSHQTVRAAISDPVIGVVSTNSQETVTFSVADATSGVTMYYTTDGSAPTTSSATIASGGTILAGQNSSLKVQAFQGSSMSNLVTAKYAIKGVSSAGDLHTLFIKQDGTVWASGSNSHGQLGDGGTDNNTTPVQVMVDNSTPLTKVVGVAAGTEESYAVDCNGNVWAWGFNPDGELGIGTTADTSFATKVVDSTGTPIAGFISVASSQHHTLAVKSDGTVWAWGANNVGQLGDGSTALWVTNPVQVSGLSGGSQYLQGIAAVAAGAYHSVAIDNGGNVYAWGDNTSGTLGNNDASGSPQLQPVQTKLNGVPLTGVVAVAAGNSHSMALRSDGSVVTWGDNTNGELGNGDSTGLQQNQAVVVNGMTSAIAIAAGNGFSRAITQSGTSYSWGDNSSGQIGVGLAGGFAAVPIVVTYSTNASLSITATSGNGQSVTDGTISAPFTLTVTENGVPAANTWIDVGALQSDGLLTASPTGGGYSPIISVETNSEGVATVYFQGAANASGPVQLTAASGTAQTSLSALTNVAVAASASGEPTMPEWMLIIMAVLLVVFANRSKKGRFNLLGTIRES